MHPINLPKGQPDLDTLVRLFISALNKRPANYFKIRKYFRIFLKSEDEAVLGSNRRNLEIRLYVMRHKNISNEIFFVLALYKLNWLGYLQSVYLHPLLKILLWSMLRTIKNHPF